MQGHVPDTIAYDLHRAEVIPANRAPVNVAGLWRYVYILNTDRDTLEVSYNGGGNWTAIPKGLLVRIPDRGETSRMQLRNTDVADATVDYVVGNGELSDFRLVVSGAGGNVPVDIKSPLSAGAVMVREQAPRADVCQGGAAAFYAQKNAAAAGVAEVILAAGGNLTGLRITYAFVKLDGAAADAEHAEVWAESAGKKILIVSVTGGVVAGLNRALVIPAGYAINAKSSTAAGLAGYGVGWELLP